MANAAFTPLPAGIILGNRYQLRKTIATGGMGCVYLAHAIALDAPVAVKVLRPDLVTPEAVDRFRRESLLASEITHPNVVRVIDYGESDEGLPYLVMEYVPGLSLAELVRQEGPQRLARVISLMEQLLAALDELHAHLIAHGDVSSENLLLQPTRHGGMWLKLADFGLARRVAAFDLETLPRARELLISGTPGYIAPEVLRGEGLGFAADVYSAGVVLHELLTGQLPFPAATPQDMVVAQLAEAPAPASMRFPLLGIPSGFDSLIERALCIDGAARLPVAHFTAALGAAARERRTMTDGFWRGPLLVGPVGGAAHDRAPTVPDVESVTAVFATPFSRPEVLRERIGKAMRSGNMDHMAALYLGLAKLLRATGNSAEAIAELDEAVAVLTLGGGEKAAAGPQDMWRLLLLLAEMQAVRGSIAAARASAAFAYRHADRRGSGRGRSRALLMLRQLPG